MFQIQCPLGHALEVSAELLAQRLSCPVCQAVVYVPPPPPGIAPYAKYEVQCDHGHILRVKQKYLNKEVQCPACQSNVSMLPAKLLNASGVELGVAAPELFTSKKKPIVSTQSTPSKSEKPLAQKSSTSSPTTKPAAPELVEESGMHPTLAENAASRNHQSSAAKTLADHDELELNIVDSQLNIEMNSASPGRGTSGKRLSENASGRIPPPPREKAPPPAPPPSSQSTPTPEYADSGDDLQMHCPNGHLLAVEKQYQGQYVQCPLCQAIMQVPVLTAT